MTRLDLPTLTPSLPVLDRGGDEVQLGARPGRALVVGGLSAADRATLHRLDGSRTLAELRRTYQLHDEDPTRLDDLLRLLRAHDLVRPRGRQGTRPQDRDQAAREVPVVVAGEGALAADVARLLGERHRRVRTQHTLPAEAPSAPRPGPGARRPRALAVLVAEGALDPLVAQQWAPWAVVLPVVSTDGAVTVGPLWGDLDDPCPLCLDLARADRDPAWPRVLAQLVGRGAAPAPTAPATVRSVAAGVAAHLAADVAGPRRLPPGLSLEITPEDPVPVSRVWSIHPRCEDHEPATRALAG